MNTPFVRLVPAEPEQPIDHHEPIGRLLVNAGLISAQDLMFCLGQQKRVDAKIGDLLQAQGYVGCAEFYQMLALQQGVQYLCPQQSAPRLSLQKGLDPRSCLSLGYVPWARIGNTTLVACSDPEKFEEIRRSLPAHLHPAVMGIAAPRDIQSTVCAASERELAQQAEYLVPTDLSCRQMPRNMAMMIGVGSLLLAVCLMTGWVTLANLFVGVTSVAVFMVFAGMTMKLAGLLLLTRKGNAPETGPTPPERLPCISILVPLHDETEILDRLLERLQRLDYPSEVLDVLLIVEKSDQRTRRHLKRSDLPGWMRVIVVPEGQIQTKPRAMNYALPFCKGSIVGIYDAEDAPDPNQLRHVATRFANEPPSTVCLQGILDFYNTRSNAMSRFFTIEYATWFRLILPGVEQLGFAIPLGGTSVFFRRDALEELHGWDAHNVTEDADLGIRLARAGYQTKLIPSVTYEEANNRIWPWIKQRSRWLKGYLITYLTHMRQPWRLLLDLGLWQFFGFQVFFLSTISQFLLAPFIWSLLALHMFEPQILSQTLPLESLRNGSVFFLLLWGVSISLHMTATSGPEHRHLRVWVLGISPYLTLGTFAIYKGAWELITRPFYWEKTQHGLED